MQRGKKSCRTENNIWFVGGLLDLHGQLMNKGFDTKKFAATKGKPTPLLLPGESHGRRSLVGYSPRGHEELDTTEQLHLTVTIPQPAFKNVYLKSFEEFKDFWAQPPVFLKGPEMNLSLPQTPKFCYYLALLCIRHRNLHSITKIQKHFKCLSTHKWITKSYMHIMEYYSP